MTNAFLSRDIWPHLAKAARGSHQRCAVAYRPPLIPGAKAGKRRQPMTSKLPALPRLILPQLYLENWSERDQALHDDAILVAKKRRKHPRSFELDSFRETGRSGYQRGDVLIQVADEGSSGVLVTRPGNILHVRTRRDRKGLVSFVYLERPARRRRHVKSLARALGCTQKRLRRNHLVRDPSFAQALLSTWAAA